MALSARQERIYVHTVHLYKPLVMKIGPTGQPVDVRYPTTPTYSSVLCYRETKDEVTAPRSPVGRTNQDNMFTIDKFHFDAAQDIGGNWAIKFTTSGHPDSGLWFITMGESMVKNYRANKLSLLAKRSTKPPGVT